MKGPTMRRLALGSTRRTAKPGPSSWARPWIKSSMGSAMVFSYSACAARPPAWSRAIRACAMAPAVTTCPTCDSATDAALNAAAYDLTGDFHGCCIFATFCWTCGLSVATLDLSRAKAWGSDRGIGEFAVGLREIVLRFNGPGEG